MKSSTKTSLVGLGLLLTGAGIRAGELDGFVSNQSSKGPITITLCRECAKEEDVLVKLLDPPLGRGAQALAPAVLKGEALSRKLEPGQTAVISLARLPEPDQPPVLRTFRVTQDGQAGECRFTYQVRFQGGRPEAVIETDEGTSPRADLEQPDPNLVLFWGYLLTGS